MSLYELADKYLGGFDGHCGVYVGLDNAIQSAKERLAGNKDLVAVYIYDRQLETYVARVEWQKKWESQTLAEVKLVYL